MTTLPVVQFYKGRWYDQIVPLLKTHPLLRHELHLLCEDRLQVIESVLEEDLEPKDLAAEMALEEHIGRVRRHDFHWMIDNLGNHRLYSLSLLIAQELFPDKQWDVLEQGDEIIVADRERTIVFDFEHCHDLSGRASLALCGDTDAMSDPATEREVEAFYEARHKLNQWRIQKMQDALAAQRDALIIELPRKP